MRVIVCVSCVLCDGVCFCSSCRGAVPTALLAGPIVSVHDGHAGHEADSGTTGCFQLLEGGTLATAYALGYCMALSSAVISLSPFPP